MEDLSSKTYEAPSSSNSGGHSDWVDLIMVGPRGGMKALMSFHGGSDALRAFLPLLGGLLCGFEAIILL
jgi:hypothetical protein